MYYKFVSERGTPEGFDEESYGSYNVAPKGWRPLSQEDFIRSRFTTYVPVAMAHRQLHRDINGEGFPRMISCTLYFYSDGTGYAVEHRYWDKEINYFAFGCEHEYTSRNVGRCLHEYTCTKCEHKMVVDSSD